MLSLLKNKNLIIIALSIALFISVYSFASKSVSYSNLSRELLHLNDTITYLKDRNGLISAEKHSLQLTVGELKDLELINKDLKRKIGKLKNLVNSTTVSTVTTDTIVITLEDTIGGTFFWEDSWLSINGRINKSKLSLGYSLENEYEVTTYWKRKGLFKRKELTVSVKDLNPNVRTTDIQSITIKKEPIKWYETRGFFYGVGIISGILIIK
mgnify:CR=1 FL=1